MYTNESTAVVASLNISRNDANNAALTMLRNSATAGEIKANDKLASQTLNAYLLGAIRDGWQRDDVEAFRVEAYKRAEASGIVVNTKSNSLLTATSRAAGFCDRPDARSIADKASTLSEALRIAKDADASKAKALADEAAALEALVREEREQTERDAMAFRLQRQIEDDKISGKYQAELVEKIQTLVRELQSLDVECRFTIAETTA